MTEKSLLQSKQYTNSQNKDFTQINQSSTESQDLLMKLTKSLKVKPDKYLLDSFKNIDKNLQNLPPKLQQIEVKLEKYREEKIKHEIIAKQQKDEEEAINKALYQEFRQMELQKIKNNNKYVKEQTQHIYENWMKTQEIQDKRIAEDQRFQEFMTTRIKNRLIAQQQFEKKDFQDGLDYYVTNCIRQGVELKHDPEHPIKPPEQFFSIPATMMKIQGRTQKAEKARKERTKRRNKMMVDQQRQQEEIDARKRQQDMLQRFQGECEQANFIANEQYELSIKEEIIKQNRIEKSAKYQQELFIYFDKMREQQKEREKVNQIERAKQYRTLKLEYMQINIDKKIEKRKMHTESCILLLDYILDLTEVCHSKQHPSDFRIDQNVWQSLLTRFKQGKSLQEEKVFKIFEKPQDNNQQQQQAQAIQHSKSQQRHEMMQVKEFQDYYTGMNNWRPLHYFEEEHLDLFNRPFNDDPLGDFLHDLIDHIYPKMQINQKPDLPDYMPLKISILGHQFSGKKTIINQLRIKYGLLIINPNQIIKESLIIAFPPVEDEASLKKGGKKKETKKGQQPEEEKKENPEMKELGILVNEYVSQQKPIPDELYIKAILIKIKEQFPKLSTQELLNQVQESLKKEEDRQNELKRQQEEAAKKKTAKKPGKDVKKGGKEVEAPQEVAAKTPEELMKELMETKAFEYTAGFAFIDFPQTIQQAKLLEAALTGYVVEEERLNPEGEAKKQQVGELVQASEKVVDTCLINGGLNLIINLQVENSECVRRAVGRRIDPTTETIYHVEDNPPPADVKGLAERVKPIDNPEESPDAIQRKNEIIDQNWEQLSQWFSKFGIEENGFCSLKQIDGKGKQYDVLKRIDGEVSALLEIKKQEFIKLKANYEAVQQPNIQQEHIQQQQQQQQQPSVAPQQQTETNQLENKDQAKSANNINKPPSSSQSRREVKLEPQIKEPDKPSSAKPKSKQGERKIEGENQILPSQQQQQKESLKIQLSQVNPLDKLQKEDLIIIFKYWQEIQVTYVTETKLIFFKIIQHRELINQRSIDVQQRFLNIIQRPDDKMFQDNLNKFIEDNPDLIKYKNAKEELTKHLDQLYEGLWDSLEQKKNEAILERRQIINSGWIESEMEAVYSQYLRIYQLEMNRLHEILDLLNQISDKIQNLPVNEVKEHIILDPYPNNKEPSLEDKFNFDSFPKIEGLYQHYLQQVDTVNQKIQEFRQRFYKRHLRKKNIQKISSLELDAAEALQKLISEFEQTNAKFRALVLKLTMISRLKELKMLGQGLYNKLDDWIIFGIKRENDATYDAIKQLKNCIKNQIKSTLGQIQIKDISETYRPLNSFTIQVKILPPFEKVCSGRFTLCQLKLIADELQTITDQQGNLDPVIFNSLFLRRKNTPQCNQFLPQDMLTLNNSQIEQIAPILNPQNPETIDYKILMLCFILLSSKVPDQNNLQEYKVNANLEEESYLEIIDFVNIPTWFDENESDMNYYEGFRIDRVKLIKTMIFDLFCDEQYLLPFDIFLEEISILSQLSNNEPITFWNLLFPNQVQDTQSVKKNESEISKNQ